MAHCSSVRSDGYFFRERSFLNMRAHSCADGICANYLINLLFCQAMFPDSLSVTGPCPLYSASPSTSGGMKKPVGVGWIVICAMEFSLLRDASVPWWILTGS